MGKRRGAALSSAKVGSSKCFSFSKRRRRRFTAIAAEVTLFCSLVATSPPAHAATCENLITTQLANAIVTSAVTVSGTVKGPDGKNYSNLPEFCSVSILATPSTDSAINILLWLPTTTWNGRFEGTGNGGYAGNMAIDAPAMVYAIQNGIAAAATDMGTAPSVNNNGDVLIGHPQKWIDFGYRATHVMTDLSKDMIRAFYNSGPRYSYFNGCSTGGQQALMTAQLYPADYDGILGGDPAHDRTHTHTGILWIYAQTHKTPTSYLTPDQVNLVTNSVLSACVVKSGGVAGDTFLTDASKCDWSPSALQCTSAAQTNCLNADQVKAANAIYAGPADPVTGAQIFPGSAKGSENASLFGWNDTQSGNEPQFDSVFKWVFGPQWQASQFDYHQSMTDMDQVLASILNADNPNLSTFRSRKAKLLMYQGWADPLVAPQSVIDYFNKVVTAQGNGKYSQNALTQTQSFFRLFMVPGLNHCQGGPGPNAFGNQFSSDFVATDPPSNDVSHHALTALIQWVERGIAPAQIIATKYVNDLPAQGTAMQRPLCPYPTAAHYSGKGNTNEAASFVCR
jgi:feruloyl esterase